MACRMAKKGEKRSAHRQSIMYILLRVIGDADKCVHTTPYIHCHLLAVVANIDEQNEYRVRAYCGIGIHPDRLFHIISSGKIFLSIFFFIKSNVFVRCYRKSCITIKTTTTTLSRLSNAIELNRVSMHPKQQISLIVIKLLTKLSDFALY